MNVKGLLSFDEAAERFAPLRAVLASMKEDKLLVEAVYSGLCGFPVGIEECFARDVRSTAPEEGILAARMSQGLPAALFCFVLFSNFPGVAHLEELVRRQRMRQAWNLFDQLRTQVETIIAGTGWDESFVWESVANRRVTENDELTDALEIIARLAGRMYSGMRGPKSKVEDATPQEVRDIKPGDDLSLLLPSELALIDDEDFGDLKMVELIERRLMQFRVAGMKPVQTGPLCLLIDESTSMADVTTDVGMNSREKLRNGWAKAAAVALTRLAHEGGRAVRAVHFSTSTVTRRVDVGDNTAALKMVESFINGGTAIGEALEAAYKEVDEMAAEGNHGADIVIITDGNGSIDRKIKKRIETERSLGARLWCVGVGIEPKDFNKTLKKHAQHQVYVRGKIDDAKIESFLKLGEAAMRNDAQEGDQVA